MRLSAFTFALACAACQVGNPLVDEFKPDDGNLRIQCTLPPRCLPFPLAVEPPNHPAEPVPLKTCMKLCGWGDIDMEGCPEHAPVTSLPESAMCKDIEPKLDNSELSWSGMDWQEVNLILRADRPVRVNWSGGRLQHVYIEVHGPVELHIERLELFEDLRFQAEASAAGKPYIEIADLAGQKLSLGMEDKHVGGSLKMRAVHLKDLDVRADSLTIENSLLEEASLTSDSLTVTDVTMRGGAIDAKNARFSVFVVDGANANFCGDARLVAGSVVRSNVKVCPDSVLRVYNSTIGSCAADGAFELDDTSLEQVALGVNDATRVVAYNSNVSSTQACANTQLLALGRGSAMKCSGCADALNSEEAQPACVLDESIMALLKNYCEAWAGLEALPLCEEDLPQDPDRIR